MYGDRSLSLRESCLCPEKPTKAGCMSRFSAEGKKQTNLRQPLRLGGHSMEVGSVGLSILGLGFKSELFKSTSSVTLTSWNLGFQNL